MVLEASMCASFASREVHPRRASHSWIDAPLDSAAEGTEVWATLASLILLVQ